MKSLSRERPDILPILMDGYRYLYPEKTIPTTNRIPVFSIFEGVVSCRVLRAFVESAGPLSLKEKEALDVFQEIAERPEMGVSLMLNTGDFLLVNNFSVLHSRTGFLDADEHDRKWLLLRHWMNGECGQSVDARLREQSLRFQKI